MANRNSAGFGLIPQGTLGSNYTNQGQSKYYIAAVVRGCTNVSRDICKESFYGYVTTAQAAITNTTMRCVKRNILQCGYNFETDLAESLRC